MGQLISASAPHVARRPSTAIPVSMKSSIFAVLLLAGVAVVWQRGCSQPGASGREATILSGPQSDDSQTDERYFSGYESISEHMMMLQDSKRTSAYRDAIMKNRDQFKDKVVLDVGTGTGILAIFAAQAGARKVYAVEATSIARHAVSNVAANNVADIVKVVQASMETVNLPEKVDIIISEWMGWMLLVESMLDSVLVARDRLLKPGGALYPSHGRVLLAAAHLPLDANSRRVQLQEERCTWTDFEQNLNALHGVRLGPSLGAAAANEKYDALFRQNQWLDAKPSQLAGPLATLLEVDLHTVRLEDIVAPLKADFELEVTSPDSHVVDSLLGFFDVSFNGSAQNPAVEAVHLSAAPDDSGATHWGQQAFFLDPPIEMAAPGGAGSNKIRGGAVITRQQRNHRLLQLNVTHEPLGEKPKRVFEQSWSVINY